MKPAFQSFSGSYDEFDWHETKRITTLEARRIDFADVARYFFGRSPFFRRRSDHADEVRWQAVGPFRDSDTIISVVYTERKDGHLCWIISARKASPKEQREYDAAIQAQ
jgi:uncharacterized DUF497 family protein